MFEDIKLKLAYPSLETEFIDWLDKEAIFPKSSISSVYMAVWRDDYTNARSWMNPRIDSWDKYCSIIKRAMDSSIDVEILLQGIEKVPDDIIKKYLDLGIRKFTISNDATAYRIKELDSDVFISASITKALSPTEIMNGDYSMYDEICLFFWYTLHLSALKELPKKYEYSMCGNSGCLPVCTQCVNHWFSNEMGPCRYSNEREEQTDSVGINYTEYRKYFKDYISRVKILDRLDSTEHIVESLNSFFDGKQLARPKSYFDKNLKFPDIINKDVINKIQKG